MAGFDLGNILTGGGGALSAISSIITGNTSKELGDLQSGVFASNAEILKNQAAAAELGVDFAYAKGREQESQVRLAGDATEGAQRHWYASNYLDPAYGSPLLHQALTASQVEHDAGIVRASARIEAADAETRSVNFLSQSLSASTQSVVARAKGEAAQTAGYLGAGASLLSAGGKMFRGYSKD